MFRSVILSFLWLANAALAASLFESPSGIDDFPGNPRLFVLTDIGNEPDDQMSMVRLLLYSNELDIEGLVATTSTWQKEYAQPELLFPLLDAYGEARDNLGKNAPNWPTVETLRSRVSSGPDGYGLEAIKKDKLSSGAAALIDAAKSR